MRFPGYDARSNRGRIRWELFLHPEVRDVLLTPRADTLCVVYQGELNRLSWAATLTEAGLPMPSFGDPVVGVVSADESGDAAA
jgi:hypothetical protein